MKSTMESNLNIPKGITEGLKSKEQKKRNAVPMNRESIGVRKKDSIQILHRAMGICSSQDRIAGFARKELFLFMETKKGEAFFSKRCERFRVGGYAPRTPFSREWKEKAFLAISLGNFRSKQ